MKPLEGAESEGAKGFFKGVGKGLIGYVLTYEVQGYLDNDVISQSCYETCHRGV